MAVFIPTNTQIGKEYVGEHGAFFWLCPTEYSNVTREVRCCLAAGRERDMFFLRSIRRRWHEPQGYRDVLRVGLPLVAGMISSTAMQFTDRLFLSHYSVTSIAAAMPGTMAAVALQLPLMGLCGYVSVLIAQFAGAGKNKEVGSILWQGLWVSCLGAVVLAFCCLLAKPLFSWAAHPPDVQAEEVRYFSLLLLGSVFLLCGSVISGFFAGRGQTRPVFFANLAGAILNIPLDYMLIFGKWGAPELGITGAAIATVAGWAFCAALLGLGVFTRGNDKKYGVFRSWRIRKDMLLRLFRFGGPSGINLFMEVVGFTWFVLEVGKLGEVALAASNIAFSMNSLVFTPMLGINTAVSTLVGQAMGGKKPGEAARATTSALHLSLMYMVPLCVVLVVFAGPLMDIFRPSDPAVEYAPIRATGVVLIYYIALYSLVDSGNIVYFGALKGAGDTFFTMLILGGAGLFALVLPIVALKALDLDTLHNFWAVLTVYIMGMALCAFLRFRKGAWKAIVIVGQ